MNPAADWMAVNCGRTTEARRVLIKCMSIARLKLSNQPAQSCGLPGCASAATVEAMNKAVEVIIKITELYAG